MRAHTTIRWVAVTGAAALLLTACSHGGKGDAKGDTGPITMASIMGIPEGHDLDVNAGMTLFEESVEQCMKEEGWEYIPWLNTGLPTSREMTSEDRIERIKREGIGGAYQFLLRDGTEEESDIHLNPNDAYIAALSPTAAAEYQISLYGSEEEIAASMVTEVDAATGDEMQVSNGSFGCYGQAEDKLDLIAGSQEYRDAVAGYYAEIQDRVASDPRMVEFTKNWSACMKKSGFNYASQPEYWTTASTAYFDRANAVVDSGPGQDPTAGWTQEEIDSLYAQPHTLTAEQRTQLEEILAEEVRLGLAYEACSNDVPITSDEIYAQVEETYALEHQEELEALAVTLGIGQ